MKSICVAWLTALMLLLSAHAAQALITCSISSPGFTAGYPVNSPTLINTQTNFSITCSRGLTTDPTTTTYTVQANSGLTPAGGFNRGQSGGNFINYNVMRESTCSTIWMGLNTIPISAATITMVGLTPTTVTQNYWGCIPALQNPAAGTYTDTVIITPTYSTGVVGAASTFPVTIISPPTCTISPGPGNVNFTYTSFSTSAVTANTTFGLTCSNSIPYTMAVSPASGTLVGISYTLTLPASSTGTGALQTHTISGTAPAGQAGTCAIGTCSGAQMTTLTITY